MPIVKLLEPVTFGGSIIDAGEEVNLSELSAAALVKEGGAEYVGEISPASLGDLNENQGEGTTGTPEGEKALEGQINAQEELEKIKKTLDAKYNRDPLAEAAKEMGVEFAFNAKKAEIIDAVVEAGKAEALLQA